ncbi:MAG TPA: thiol-disulfide oxidoreductase, partial [Aequorivita sp.]|nr:thiol-disulfide oxidoreductase [Aequorivita sp.]
YDYIAKNRYNWFGKKEICMIPTAELKAKFL